ncbi:MAG: hypothetical protein ACRCZK_04970 [Oscillospiraceae bacterium]
MADILKITTPINNKTNMQAVKPAIEPNVNFQISDITKVIKPNSETALNGQNNSFLDKDSTSNLLANLLKDPAVTITYLKNIFLLQEVVKLLPINNSTFTQEIQLLFNSLLISYDDIVGELKKQENSSTAFKGELFNFLRNLSFENSNNLDVQNSIANFLKAVNSEMSKQDIMDSVENSLNFIKEEMQASANITKEIDNVIALLKDNSDDSTLSKDTNLEETSRDSKLDKDIDLKETSKDSKLDKEIHLKETSSNNTEKEINVKVTEKDFKILKTETLKLIDSIENNILFSPKISKVLSMMVYNLSRFRDNPYFLKETTEVLLSFIHNSEDKNKFINLLRQFIEHGNNMQTEKSEIMEALSTIMAKQAFSKEISAINSEKIEKIIYSLLSSPCNFTPLLHFIVPVEHLGLKSFAEIWIDVNNQEEMSENELIEKKENIHMLIVFEVEGIGQFESEIFVKDKNIDISLFCPKIYVDAFYSVEDRLRSSLQNSPYHLNKMNIDEFVKTRSLMDAFKGLPRKRTGLDIIV